MVGGYTPRGETPRAYPYHGVVQDATPVTVALVNDYPVVVEGVRRLLEAAGGVHVVELDSLVGPAEPVDVVLFDTFASQGVASADVVRLLNDARVGRVAIYSWAVEQRQVDAALAVGVNGFLSKAIAGADLADALRRIHAGEIVVLPDPMPAGWAEGDWPGREQGLTVREAEVISLITQGVTNADIARRCYLSENSVKTYIRSAYRKMGVERRSQAVRWGMERGLLPRAERRIVNSAP